jgi:hypothetical protein
VIELMLAQSGARIAVGGDHPGEVQVQVQSVGGLGCLLGPTLDTLATQLHYGVMQRVTIAFEGEDLELVEQACRELADRARRDAEAVKGTSVEPVHKSAQARFLGMAERLKVARG